MNQEILVSVIVPIYNIKMYIDKCLMSIMNQTYKNLEIILVDDGSTDGCYELCDSYVNKDKRIKVIHKKNGGLSEARNVGIENSKGEYLCFIDGDDYISEHYVEFMLREALINYSDIVQCSYARVYDSGKVENYISHYMKIYGNKVEETIIRKGINPEGYVIACNKLYKRRLFKDVRYPVGRIHEDLATTYKLIYSSNNIVVMQEILYFYVQRSNSIMNTRSEKSLLHWAMALKEKSDFFLQKEEFFVSDRVLKNYFYRLLLCLQNKACTDENCNIEECNRIVVLLMKSGHISLYEKIGIVIMKIKHLK